MAEQLKLVYRDESLNWGNATPTDIDTYDLLADKLQIDGYQQAISTDGSIVDDVVNLWKRGTTSDDLASDFQALDLYLSRVPDLKEYRNYESIWIRRQQTGESYARQACIYDAQRSPAIQAADLDSADINLLKKYQLGLKREGWWENPLSIKYTTVGGESCLIAWRHTGLQCAGWRPTCPRSPRQVPTRRKSSRILGRLSDRPAR